MRLMLSLLAVGLMVALSGAAGAQSSGPPAMAPKPPGLVDLAKGPPAPMPPPIKLDPSLLPATAQEHGHKNIKPVHHDLPKPPPKN